MTSRFTPAHRAFAVGRLLRSGHPARCLGALGIASLASAAACDRPSVTPRDGAASAGTLMSPGDLQALPSRAPDHRLSYGQDSSQYGELRLPAGPGPHPVVVLIHGGCFKAAYATARDLAPMGDALKAEGIATWNVEYRRLGQPGGGWPGTYLDVGRAVDRLRALAGRYRLDLDRVVLLGHSAGGHLAMWAAARPRVPAGSPLYLADPLPVRGAIDLAGPLDLTGSGRTRPATSWRACCRTCWMQACAASRSTSRRGTARTCSATRGSVAIR